MSGTTTGGGPGHAPVAPGTPKSPKEKLLEVIQGLDTDLKIELLEYLGKLFAEHTGDD